MHRGYIKLWRKITDNPLWTDTKFTPAQAWVDLILLANHKPGHIRIRGIKIDIPRGCCGWSQGALAERWKWSRGRVIRFLDELETVQQIEQQKNNVTTLIKINNYDSYQADSTANSTANGQQTDSKRYTNKNDKNDKNDKNNITRKLKRSLPDDFVLTESLKKYALDNRIDPKSVAELFKRFQDYHIGHGTKMLDWNRAWYTFVKNAPQFSPWALSQGEDDAIRKFRERIKQDPSILQGAVE